MMANICIAFILFSVAINEIKGAPGYSNSWADASTQTWQATAGATAGVGHAEGRLGPLYGQATGPESGAYATGGQNAIGAGFRATLGEVEGRVGGAFGVGGKLGLSADTNAEIGENGFKLHVLGSGGSITPDKGLEFCLFGSCISFG